MVNRFFFVEIAVNNNISELMLRIESLDTNEIRNNLRVVTNDVEMMTLMTEIEHIFDNCHLFAYQNWFEGELVNGPTISNYWVKTTWMYPYKSMPDPMGGLRLLKKGCKVKYRQSTFKFPIEVKGPEDIVNRTSQEPKIQRAKVWLIEVDIPKWLVDEYIANYIELSDDTEMNASLEKYDQDLFSELNQEAHPDQLEQTDQSEQTDELDDILGTGA